MTAVEVNFDGIVGPTHHYGGLSPGNIASQTHRLRTSHPKQAALEGLAKMKLLADLGIRQAVLPPHERPDFGFLRQQGFEGNEATIVETAARERLDLLSTAYSASAMWAANAATVCPSADTQDHRIHFTPANLISTAHRRLEPIFTTKLFRKIFANTDRFVVHNPLSEDSLFADEGAANHMRLCRSHGESGVEVFVYGRGMGDDGPQRFPARQTIMASTLVASDSRVPPERMLLVQQNPAAIDAGVFHNDVIAVANERVLLCHAEAYRDQPLVIQKIAERFPELQLVEVSTEELSLAEAVETYLFNSQLVTLPNGSMLLLCPIECAEHPRARAVVDRIVRDIPIISKAQFVDVRQSMQNGGGPACLRLRVVLTQEELAAVHQPVFLTDDLHRQLTTWVERHYREELTVESLGDPRLVTEVRDALDELTRILQLGAIYPFQLA